ncbi:hypothetical protein O9H85_08215 [Paenibacillus filicis]|uniref:Uncharacterized protein n=1 Tax=Paenibacillus gyeongsangnamensis TaxID=3388067 RepID=A0ABT4Q6B7_9BACL|nr:hypothetical protein [Paenibacillus filicis]MCZ8512417.1 hypothetical protein [Paenibacillus filicis]
MEDREYIIPLSEKFSLHLYADTLFKSYSDVSKKMLRLLRNEATIDEIKDEYLQVYYKNCKEQNREPDAKMVKIIMNGFIIEEGEDV